MRKNLLIAGGGTGGHIAPALASGKRAQGFFNVYYACTPRPVDRRMYAEAGVTAEVMDPPRVDRGMRLLLPFTALRALVRAVYFLRKKHIDIVLGTGGYSSFYSIAAAGLSGIPAALFESNAHAGRSNRLASRFCRKAFTGFSAGAEGLRCRSFHTGTPVSGGLRRYDREAVKAELGIPDELPAVLFLGGSQGAEAVNDLALGIKGDFHVLLQCGARDHERVCRAAEGREDITVEPFIDDLSKWYSAAELAVARAGGQTIAELSAFRLPAVLVPFPYAAEDHQTLNALEVESARGGIMKQEAELDPSGLSGILCGLLTDRGVLREMGKAISGLYPEDPAGRIVEHLKELVE